MIQKLTEATGNVTDETLFVTSDNNLSNTNLFYRRAGSKLWNYIKAKANDVYLPLTGGTLTGSLTINNNTENLIRLDGKEAQTTIYVMTGGEHRGFMGYIGDGLYLWNKAGKRIGMTDEGVAVVNGKKIWYEDNDGSGSGLNADLLDGKHNGEVTAKALGFVNLRKTGSDGTVGMKVSEAKSNILNAVKGSVFGNVTLIGASVVDNWADDDFVTVNSSSYAMLNVNPSYNGDEHGQYLLFGYGVQNPKIIGRNGTAWTEKKILAFTSDNVASATKLANSHTFWGQSFNGTQNVSGNMTSVAHITPWKDNESNCGASDTHWRAVYTRQVVSNLESMLWMYHGKAQPLGFATAATERMRITAAGYVGIGTTDPTAKLHVAGSALVTGSLSVNSTAQIGSTEANGAIELYHSTPFIDFHFGRSTKDYTSRLIEEASGRLAVIGTLRVSVGMYSNGYISARGQNTSSDAKLKRNLTPFEISLDAIKEAPSVGFDWKSDSSHDVGSIAQYWRNISPQLTPEAPDGSLTLQYGKTALLSVISVARKVSDHEERIEELERENEELKRKLEMISR